MSTAINYWDTVPGRRKAQGLGCTCTWWGQSILHFDDDCPIGDRHFKGQIVHTPAPHSENGSDSRDAT